MPANDDALPPSSVPTAQDSHEQPQPQPTDPNPDGSPADPTPATSNASTAQDGSEDVNVRGPEPQGVQELVIPEGVQDQDALSAEQVPASAEEGEHWSEDDNHEIKRVKVYELVGSRWVDKGTAFCSGHFEDSVNEAFLIARSEQDYHKIILQTSIRTNDVYQRQQDTLIVWTEPDGVDYALSFQDPDGCAEVWNFILEVQRIMSGTEDQMAGTSSPVLGSEAEQTALNIMRTGRLPAPAIGVMEEVDRAIKTLTRAPNVKERLCEFILQEGYIKQMVDFMQTMEDLESLSDLHALCGLMQTLLMLNDHAVFEHILDDELFVGVLGMLEYDPEFPTYKANYRDFLTSTSRFHQPIPIADPAVRRKIHHTYRLQFLKDVVLARSIDDSTANVLNSCVLFNQIDIINHVQHDPGVLREVVRPFVDEKTFEAVVVPPGPPGAPNANPMSASMVRDSQPNGHAPDGEAGKADDAAKTPEVDGRTEDARRREVIQFVQQLCQLGKNVQLPARMALFRTLVDRGVVCAAQWALAQPDHPPEQDENAHGPENVSIVAAAGEVLGALLDHDLNGVRAFVVRQVQLAEKADKVPEQERKEGERGKLGSETVLALMCRIMAHSRDLAVQSQVGDALKLLLDIPQADQEQHSVVAVKMLSRAKDDPTTEKFLDYFYKQCIETLFKPFGDIPEFRHHSEPVLPLTRETTNLYLYLCDLLCNFALQHSFRSHFFVLSSKIASRVATLLSARDKHLRLAAFRFFRVCLKLNNRNLINHLIQQDLLAPIFDLTIAESRRDNLLSSSCNEFFEHMRRENLKDLISHCMTKHEAKVRQLSETTIAGTRFKMFIRRWEMNNEPPPPEEVKPEKPIPDSRTWGQGRVMEVEEEDYFNGDDDDDDDTGDMLAGGNRWTQHILKAFRRKRGRALSVVRPVRPPNPTPPLTPPLGSLVDYVDEDEDDGGSNLGLGRNLQPIGPQPSSPSDASASPRLSHRPLRPQRDQGVDQDDAFEALASGGGAPKLAAPVLPLSGVGDKRRREEDEDELAALVKPKRPAMQRTDSASSPSSSAPNSTATGDAAKSDDEPSAPAEPVAGGPKKIKLKLGAVSKAVAGASAPSAAPNSNGSSGQTTAPEPGAKDGDGG